jgi:hypothetical protein
MILDELDIPTVHNCTQHRLEDWWVHGIEFE